MKVLHVIAGLNINGGGTSRSVPNQCIHTVAVGTEVGLVTLRDGTLSREAQFLPDRGVSVSIVRASRAIKDLPRLMGNYDLIHVNGIWSLFNAWASGIAIRSRKPLIITPHGMLEPWSLGQKVLKKSLAMAVYQRTILNAAQCLQATAPQEAVHLRSLGLKAPIVVIPNGIEQPPRFSKTPVHGKNRRLLFLSRIHPKKGLIELVRACATRKEELISGRWKVCVAGSDDCGHLERVRLEVRRLGLEGFFDWIGPVDGDEKWQLYQSAEVFVLPTYSENFGIVVAEALSCGLPVLTTRGAPWSELERHRCGWWIETGQTALEESLLAVLKSPTVALRTMGKRGRKLVDQKYRWEGIGMQLRKTYTWLLDGSPEPDFLFRR